MFDEIDMKIMNILGKEGRKSNVDLARQLGIPNSTVRQRLKRLTEMGILNFSCEINPEKFKEIIIVFTGIIMNSERENILNELNNLPNKLFSVVLTGRFDFLLAFAAESTDMINKTLKVINDIDGVAHIESFIVLENHGLYIKSDKFSQIYRDVFFDKIDTSVKPGDSIKPVVPWLV